MSADLTVLGDDLLLDVLARAERLEADCAATAWQSTALALNACEATRLADSIRAEMMARVIRAAEAIAGDA